MRRSELRDENCGIAQALGVLGDWWTFLIVREIAGGTSRFDALQQALGISRRALAEHLDALVGHGVLHRQPYSTAPPRSDYLLTRKGEGLLPVLIALQDWGDRHVLGDGTVTALAGRDSVERARIHELVGRPLPPLELPATDGTRRSVGDLGRWSVVYCFPGAYGPDADGYPVGWSDIPGAAGCTLESLTYKRTHPAFTALGVDVVGVSTQRPDQQAAFAAHAGLPFSLLADEDTALAVALRLPTFRVAGIERYKRLTLLLDSDRVIRAVQAPITDPAASVDEMLTIARGLQSDALPTQPHPAARS